MGGQCSRKRGGQRGGSGKCGGYMYNRKASLASRKRLNDRLSSRKTHRNKHNKHKRHHKHQKRTIHRRRRGGRTRR